MPKYLFHGTYIGDGVNGLLHDGGSGRVKAVREAADSMGGKLESFYFAFGKDDFHVIVDLPAVRPGRFAARHRSSMALARHRHRHGSPRLPRAANDRLTR